MSLRRIKTLYCVAVISIAVVLACVGGTVGWVTSIVMLCGALPMFRAVSGAAGDIAARAIIKNAESQDRPDSDALLQ